MNLIISRYSIGVIRSYRLRMFNAILNAFQYTVHCGSLYLGDMLSSQCIWFAAMIFSFPDKLNHTGAI